MVNHGPTIRGLPGSHHPLSSKLHHKDHPTAPARPLLSSSFLLTLKTSGTQRLKHHPSKNTNTERSSRRPPRHSWGEAQVTPTEDSMLPNGTVKKPEGGICSGARNTLPCRLTLTGITLATNLIFKILKFHITVGTQTKGSLSTGHHQFNLWI